MNNLTAMKKILFVAFIYMSILSFSACSNQGDLSITGTNQQTLFKSGKGSNGTSPADSSALLLVRKREAAENGVTTAVIGPEGGVIIHAAHRIEIPAGALTDFVKLSFSMPVSDTLMFEFGPDGIQFQAPVKVILNYDHTFKSGLDAELFKAVFWNATTQTWDSVPSTVNTETNEVTGSANHFSRYAISKG